MRTKNITKIIALLLLVSVILRFCFVFTHLKHDCTHEDDCPICTLIHKFTNELDGFDPSLSKIVITLMIFFPSLLIYYNRQIKDKKKYTLVGLKIELIN